MGDRVDEWVMGRIGEFEGKRFKDVARGDLELGGLAEAAERARIDEERASTRDCSNVSRMRSAIKCSRCA